MAEARESPKETGSSKDSKTACATMPPTPEKWLGLLLIPVNNSAELFPETPFEEGVRLNA